MVYEIKIGADPELFFCVGSSPRSAHGVLPGCKEEPYPVNGGAIQVDGTAAEFNIDPCGNSKEFSDKIESVMGQLLEYAPEYGVYPKPTATFDKDYFETLDPLSKILGCEPDFNGYSREENVVLDPGDTPFRTAGGHVHLGGYYQGEQYDWDHFLHSCEVAKAMDKYLGVYSVLWDDDHSRRSLYGNPAAFRPKSYGMEYRSLSNAWVFNPLLREVVFDFSKEAIHSVLAGERVEDELYSEIMLNNDVDHQFFKGNEKVDRVMECIYNGL